MSTPNLSTFVRERVLREEQRMQTAFPAKVVSYQESAGTVTVEPQFIETWVGRDGTRTRESAPDGSNVTNVPVCFPWYLSWEVTAGDLGLVICTKYSLDLWRQQLQPVDPGDLRRFTMSGATFHPVIMGSSPSVAQDFVALASKIDAFFDAYVNATAVAQDGGEAIQIAVQAVWNGTTDTVASSKVKVEV